MSTVLGLSGVDLHRHGLVANIFGLIDAVRFG
jgi:hypothetical protein